MKDIVELFDIVVDLCDDLQANHDLLFTIDPVTNTAEYFRYLIPPLMVIASPVI